MFKKIVVLLTLTGLLYVPSFAMKEPINYELIKNFIDSNNADSLRSYLAKYPDDLDTILNTKITPNEFYFTYGREEHFCQIPLHYAAATNKKEIVALLLELAPNKLELKDPYNQATPVWCAAFNDNLDIIRYLKSQRANLEAEDDTGYDPLLLTIARRFYRTFSYLLQQNVKLKYRDGFNIGNKITGDTSLMVFLAKPEDLFFKRQNNDDSYNFRMFYAILKKHEENLQGIDTPNKNKRTPLMLAIKGNNKVYVSALLNRGANINAKDIYSQDACNYANKYADKDIKDLVCIKRKVSLNTSDIEKAENKIKGWLKNISF